VTADHRPPGPGIARLRRGFRNRIRPLLQYPADRWRARRLLDDPADRVLRSTADWSDHITIIATCPRIALAPSVSRLIDVLREIGATVILVANESADRSQCTESWIGRCDVLIHRANIGRDFGAYQRATQYVRAHAPVASIGRISYFNDSVAYLPNSIPLLTDWLGTIEHDQSLTMIGVEDPWIQTFALTLASTTAFSPEITRFWRRYIPTDGRATVIRRGEKRLSTILRTSTHPPTSHFTIEKLDAAIGGDWGSLSIDEARGLDWALRFRPQITRVTSLDTDALGSGTTEARRRVAFEIPRWMGPNRPFGLVANRTLGFPIKLDLISVGAASPEAIAGRLSQSSISVEEQRGLLDLMCSHRFGR
jgi:hypothetical protein